MSPTPMNMRPWREWSDAEPQPCPSFCVEGEYVDENGRLATAPLTLYHSASESRWGFSTGDWREGTYKTHHPKFHRWRYVGPELPTKAMQGQAMLIWKWWDAPGELRALSPHGGDEDYVAVLPEDMEQPSWMETGSSFGCCDVSEHRLDDGRGVYIGAHA